MLRAGLFVFLTSVAATLVGAWSAAFLFPTLAPVPLLWVIGGAVDGVGYAFTLLVVGAFFPNAFSASFPVKPKKA